MFLEVYTRFNHTATNQVSPKTHQNQSSPSIKIIKANLLMHNSHIDKALLLVQWANFFWWLLAHIIDHKYEAGFRGMPYFFLLFFMPVYLL